MRDILQQLMTVAESGFLEETPVHALKVDIAERQSHPNQQHLQPVIPGAQPSVVPKSGTRDNTDQAESLAVANALKDTVADTQSQPNQQLLQLVTSGAQSSVDVNSGSQVNMNQTVSLTTHLLGDVENGSRTTDSKDDSVPKLRDVESETDSNMDRLSNIIKHLQPR